MSTKAEKIRELVTEAWARWHDPISPRLARADSELVVAELDRRRARADRIHRDEHAAIDRLEDRWRAAAGYPSRRTRVEHDGSVRARIRAELASVNPDSPTVSLTRAQIEELLAGEPDPSS